MLQQWRHFLTASKEVWAVPGCLVKCSASCWNYDQSLALKLFFISMLRYSRQLHSHKKEQPIRYM